MSELLIRQFDAVPWDTEGPDGRDDRLEAAEAAGYRRKRLHRGEGDAHLTYIEMGPGLKVEPHSHNAGEIIYVLAGSLTPSDRQDELKAGDSLMIPQGHVYGFQCGDDGVKFLIVRPAAAGIDYAT